MDQDEVRFPLIQALPFETPTWKVDYRIEGPMLVLRVTLTPILGRSSTEDDRVAGLRAAKADFLAWLAFKGVAPGSVGLVWTPTEAVRL